MLMHVFYIIHCLINFWLSYFSLFLILDTIEEVIPTSIWKNESDVYSYVDFMDVDARIKLYLYQMLFEDDNEGLLMIARVCL